MKYQSLFTISPLIMSESFPKHSSIEAVVSEYFHLFNIYSTNPYVVREYMSFIDYNFDFAFTKLGYRIIEYRYPESDNFSMIHIIKSINSHYNLTYQNTIDLSYRVNTFTVYDYTTGKDVEMYLNDYALYDSGLMCDGLINDPDIMDNLLHELTYMNNSNWILNIIYSLEYYIGAMSDNLNHVADSYDSGIISEPLLALTQLKAFIKHTMEERQ